MKAKVTFNSTEFGKQAGDLVGRLVKAQQEAVNATGKRVIDGLRVVMDEKIDSPVRFTLNSFSLLRARGRHTDAAIAIKPIQQDYMKYAFAGGVRTDDVIPSKAAKLNKHGNMTRFYTRGIVNQKKGFWKTARSGVRTLFVRLPGGGIEAVAYAPKKVSWKPIFDPVEESRALVADILPEEAQKAFAKLFPDE